jgi:hypothetical protein
MASGHGGLNSRAPPVHRPNHQNATGAWDDGQRLEKDLMYTDWTAVILLLLTAAPLAAVVATTAFFIWRGPRKPLR